MHGDLYAHNILINDKAHSLLGDFGAATFYRYVDSLENRAFERLEVRAFGCLLEDLLDRCAKCEQVDHANVVSSLRALQKTSMSEYVEKRPLFNDIVKELQRIHF